MELEPLRFFSGEVFPINEMVFICPHGEDIEIGYKAFHGKSSKGKEVFHVFSLHFDGVPRSDFFSF